MDEYVLYFSIALSIAVLIGFFYQIKLVYDIKSELSTKRPLKLLYDKYEKARIVNPDEAPCVLREIFYVEWEKVRSEYNGTSEDFQESLKEKYAKWIRETGVEVPDLKVKTVYSQENV